MVFAVSDLSFLSISWETVFWYIHWTYFKFVVKRLNQRKTTLDITRVIHI